MDFAENASFKSYGIIFTCHKGHRDVLVTDGIPTVLDMSSNNDFDRELQWHQEL